MIKSSDQDTRERILSAARTVFQRRGTAGARMAEIAEVADVNQALLHYHFRSKGKLAETVFLEAARELFPAVLRALMSDRSLEEKVERVIALELDALRRHPYLPGYVLAELNQHPERVHQFVRAMTGREIPSFAPALLSGLDRQIAAAVEAGQIRPIPVDQFVINLLSLCIFPFAARPMLMAVTGLDERGWDAMIETRKADLPGFFMRGLS